MSRRAFVGGMALLGGSTVCRADLLGFLDSKTDFSAPPGPQSFKPVRGPALFSPWATSPDDPRKFKSSGWAPTMPGALKVLNFETNEVTTVPTPMSAHVFDQHPIHSNIFVGPSKHSKDAAVVDLDKKETIATLSAPHRFLLYGHLAFDPSGKRVVLTSHNEAKDTGALCIYDCETWKIIGIVPSGGSRPHDCFRTASGHLLVVNEDANAAALNSTISLLRFSDLKIEKNWTTPLVAHIQSMGPDRIILSGVLDDQPTNIVSLDLKTGKQTTYQEAVDAAGIRLTGEALSLAKLTDNEVGITIPAEKKVLIWNLQTNSVGVITTETFVQGLVQFNGQIYANDMGHKLYRFP